MSRRVARVLFGPPPGRGVSTLIRMWLVTASFFFLITWGVNALFGGAHVMGWPDRLGLALAVGLAVAFFNWPWQQDPVEVMTGRAAAVLAPVVDGASSRPASSWRQRAVLRSASTGTRAAAMGQAA